MTSTISRCIICGQFFDSKKELKHHKDKNHRITDLKMKLLSKATADQDNRGPGFFEPNPLSQYKA
jgi:uncharacterized C2H2 Zn-finger protein